MSDIARIEKRLEEAQQILDRYSQTVKAEPDNFAYKLSLQSMEDEVERLQHELQEKKSEREVEVLELRFKGKKAEAGSLPLHLVGEILKSFADVLHESSYYRRYGKVHTKGPIPKDIIKLMDLRLANIAPGSTKIYITGRLSPDLFGYSLLEQSLSGTINLLRADSPDDLADAVNEVGMSTARKLSTFLKELSGAELELDLNWQTPQDEKIHWEGRSSRIRSLSQSLERIKQNSDQKWVRGQIVMEDLRGRLEIHGEDGIRYMCTFPQNLYETVRHFHIGDDALAHIEVNTYVNLATGAEKKRFKLLTMRDPERFKDIEHL